MYQQLYNQVMDWIPPKSRVLDLGTGNGDFLARLVQARQVTGEGVEKDPELVTRCIAHGLVVHQGDVLDGLDQYGAGAFDYILFLGTLQELVDPHQALREAFRVGKQVVVSYSNFAHLRARFQMMFSGRAPVTKSLPSSWYQTRNLHFCSVWDFQQFCRAIKVRQARCAYFNTRGTVGGWPNLRAELALTMLESDGIETAENNPGL